MNDGLAFPAAMRSRNRAIVGFHIGLARAHVLPLLPQKTRIESNSAFLRSVYLLRRDPVDKHTHETNLAGRANRFDNSVHRQIRDFVSGGSCA